MYVRSDSNLSSGSTDSTSLLESEAAAAYRRYLQNEGKDYEASPNLP